MPDNGQVERMNRTIKDATVRRYYYDTHDQLRDHLGDFLAAYNFARRLKTLRGLPPTSTSARSLQASGNASGSTRSIKCRD
jgi:transposase InsO family protein